MRSLLRSSKRLRLAVLVAGLAGLAVTGMAWQMVRRERESGAEDLGRRASLLAHRLAPAVAEALESEDLVVPFKLGPSLEGHRRLLGFAVFRPDGRMVASGENVVDLSPAMSGAVARALAGEEEAVEMVRTEDYHLHVLASRLGGGAEHPARGILAVLHDASYLEERATGGLLRGLAWVFVVVLVLLTSVSGLTWIAYERPLHRLAKWMKRLRMEDAPESPPPGLPVSGLAEESEHLAASFRAAKASRWEDSREVLRAERVWTRERLATHAIECLGGDPLIVVSNREPYMHRREDGVPRAIVPASGVVTALDPILQACGGLWVAHGAGDADRETADSEGRLTVPPGDPRYTLKRVWISREDEQGYYYGFSNEGLWPLCHLAHERPTFRAADWDRYVRVNKQFAEAVLAEVGSGDAVVWLHDYHLALVPRAIKAVRPDLKVGLFWHIPWPNPEAFRICPWRVEVLEGMLGADVLGFHLQQHCNNFLDTVDRMVEARLDWDQFAVDLKGHATRVRPFPISVQAWSERGVPAGDDLARRIAQLRARHGLQQETVVVGVDRIDYTKGLPERFRAVGRFLEKHPEWKKRFTFVQLGAPSRTLLPRYRDLATELQSLSEEINWRFQTDGWKPIRFLVAHHDAAAVHAFLSMASVGVVSSLHDGMNLVAKEYVQAKDADDGVLILSEFAGASRELPEALLVNPYDTEEFAEALRRALEMDPAERARRMSRMRRRVEENNVYRWAAGFLVDLAQGKGEPVPAGGERARG
ncbi:MAG TPA: trehalose-6-phosphate synthase [Planctomycetota bacterium]|nr:trehalose-6-phosphate synthase [Planctomycetota bacterium]